MALYRVLKNLSTGDKKGEIVDGDLFKSLDILVARKALTPVSTPPLSELPGQAWVKRAEKLATIGVITVQDFIDADDKILAKQLKYKSTAVIKKLKTAALEWLKPPEVKRGK